MYHDLGHEFSEHCYAEYGTQLDQVDEFCTAYGKFVDCMQHVVVHVADV